VANRLSHETSPYLQQHAENPVDWYPWGEEALARARAEDRPILLSIGYSACHWCHVMAHESFENPEIATLMNDSFVNIKVDREERPDLDAIYMQAIQAITGTGGWPMTVFLTPDSVPFYGGTYYPPQDHGGRPGFPRVLRSVAEAFRSRRDDITRSAGELLQHLQQAEQPPADGETITATSLDQAFSVMQGQFDQTLGGFGGAPKFPQPMTLEFLLRYQSRLDAPQALGMVEQTLSHMARGGIYDHLGGGFHRYSTDARWLVPHFEKMLYDNAQLVRVFLNAYQVTGREQYRRVVEETVDYLLREMRAPEGGFYSTQDADSEGKEGKFFVWTPDEIAGVLGPDDARPVCLYFDVTAAGNFEGKNILHTPRSLDEAAGAAGLSVAEMAAVLDRARPRLMADRERRVHPGLDDKVVTSWNGLALRALAEAARSLDRDDYLEAAVQNAQFVERELWQSGRLRRTWRSGTSKGDGYLEDYACLTNGLLSLYEATFDAHWFAWAQELGRLMITLFGDGPHGGFFDTAAGGESLILRPRDLFDNAMPSGNSAAAEALLRLSAFTGDAELERWARSVLDPLATMLARHPTGFGHALCAAEFALGDRREVAIVGAKSSLQTRALRGTVFGSYLPAIVVAGAEPGDSQAGESVPLLAGRLEEGSPRAYVCRQFVCQMPVTDPAALTEQLGVTRR
jgi:uncharacterized protein